MVASLLIFSFSLLGMFLLLFFRPSLKIGSFKMPTFFLSPLVGAILCLSFHLVDYDEVFKALFQSDGIGPLGIIVLFLSMSLISIILDEAGFFSYLAALSAKKAKGSQRKLFLIVYGLVSFLTIFTSNDIVILTFTPFVLEFAKEAKISPKPYLVAEFVGANTWSMLLIIGNPTNIYLSSAVGLGFFSYLKFMFLPTILAGVSGYFFLLLFFHKTLREPFPPSVDSALPPLNKKVSLTALVILLLTTVLMSISSFLNLSMWVVSLVGASLLLLFVLLYDLRNRDRFSLTKSSLRRPSYEVAPFILSMFILVYALKYSGFAHLFASSLQSVSPYLGVGLSSFVLSGLLNNIPTSVLFSELFLEMGSFTPSMAFLAIISSNLGAFFTPLGALAGLMWEGMLRDHHESFAITDFLHYLTPTSIVSLLMAFLGYFLISIAL